jgi:hypothetical protein
MSEEIHEQSFEDSFRQKFDDWESPPPAEAWDKIAPLIQPKAWYLQSVWRWLIGGSMLGISILGWLTFAPFSTNESSQITQKQSKNTSVLDEQPTSALIPDKQVKEESNGNQSKPTQINGLIKKLRPIFNPKALKKRKNQKKAIIKLLPHKKQYKTLQRM